MQSNVVPLVPFPGARTYWPEFVLVEGHKRRRWVVMERDPDGNETWIRVYRNQRSAAFYMADIYTQAERRRRRDIDMLASHPLGKAVLRMSPDQRDWMGKLIRAAQSLIDTDREGLSN